MPHCMWGFLFIRESFSVIVKVIICGSVKNIYPWGTEMNQLNKYKKIRSWQQHVERDAPKVGEVAPDFSLTELDGSHKIRLSQFRGEKPVVLVFGSHT